MSKVQHKDNPPLSKYARKQLERALGNRPVFEFVEKAPVTYQPDERTTTVAYRAQVLTDMRTVTATVVKRTMGNFFLQTEEGERLCMNFNRVRKSAFRRQVKVGTILKCVVVPHHDSRDPRVKEVLNIIKP